jgi:hypothetical protein
MQQLQTGLQQHHLHQLQMTNTDTQTAKHVEALISLGWRWEGRALVPAWQGQRLPTVQHEQLSQELINHPCVNAQ